MRLPRLACAVIVVAFAAGCATGADKTARVNEERLEDLRDEQRAREAARTPLARPEPTTPSQLLAEADALRDSGEHGRALWAYLEAYRLDRDDPRAVERIARLHLLAQPEKAAEIFDALLVRDPNSPDALTGLGLARLAQDNSDAALELFDRALARDAKHVPALNALAVVRASRNQHAEARGLLERAWQAQPRNQVVLNNLGASYLSAGDCDAAISTLERALALVPNDAAALNNLGLALACDGQEEEALSAFRKAGDEQSAFNNMGVAAFRRGEFDRALVWYEKALLQRGPLAAEIRRNVIALQAARARAGQTD